MAACRQIRRAGFPSGPGPGVPDRRWGQVEPEVAHRPHEEGLGVPRNIQIPDEGARRATRSTRPDGSQRSRRPQIAERRALMARPGKCGVARRHAKCLERGPLIAAPNSMHRGEFEGLAPPLHGRLSAAAVLTVTGRGARIHGPAPRRRTCGTTAGQDGSSHAGPGVLRQARRRSRRIAAWVASTHVVSGWPKRGASQCSAS